jgi:hypothetical protein
VHTLKASAKQKTPLAELRSAVGFHASVEALIRGMAGSSLHAAWENGAHGSASPTESSRVRAANAWTASLLELREYVDSQHFR